MLKKIVTCLMIFNSFCCFSQQNDSSFYFINNCQFKKAIFSYEKKIKANKYKIPFEKAIDTYNLACAYAFSNNDKKALESLKASITLDSSLKKVYFTDPDFYNLINKKSWYNFIEQNRPSKYQKMEDSLFYILSKISIQDQALYKQLNCSERTNGTKSQTVKKIWEKKDSLNKNNFTVIEKYYSDSINLLSNMIIGQEFASHCFLVIQHSDSSIMNKYLPIIKSLYFKGEISGESYALLYDRVSLWKNNGKQYYGTQINTENNAIYPIIDEKNVDKRRQEMRMELLKDYLIKFNIIYSPKKH